MESEMEPLLYLAPTFSMARLVQIKGLALLFEGVPISDDRKYGCDAPVVMRWKLRKVPSPGPY